MASASSTSEEELFYNEFSNNRRNRKRNRRNKYRPSNDWKYTFDNGIARRFAENNQGEFDSLWESKEPTECCTCCSSILFSSRSVNLSDLTATEKECRLCDLISRAAKPLNGGRLNDQVIRSGSALKINSSGHRILRLCSNLGFAKEPDNQYQIGFPLLPAAGSHLRFALLREWLQWCDNSHNCKKHKTANLPTRLLYVGNPKGPDYNPEFLKLVPAEKISDQKYIALSHCWGKIKKGELPPYCTTQKNIDKREEGLKITDLPLTFRHAIEVVRGLNLNYLWIDSLCIKQGEGGDWQEESKKMEDVYASAYCTIAATSAGDSNMGFLTQRHVSDCVYIQDDSGGKVYVGTDIADFDNEVEEAQLNTRAWVVQERFLSRRTIHFGKNQMYWECGEGVYCEDLTQLKRDPYSLKAFKLDPNFPSLLFKSGFRDTLEFLVDLLKNYSKRALSERTDRAIAFSGLAARIGKALDCEEKYGIFCLYLRRNLLWQRDNLQTTMERIEYKSRDVPSWSWMAYTGGIDFMKFDFGNLELFRNLYFDKKYENDTQTLITNVWKFQDCHLKEMENAESVVGRYEIFDSCDVKQGWIMYDVKREDDFFSERGVVVVGYVDLEGAWEYYMLIVRQRDGKEGEYERVGIGKVQKGFVVRQRGDIRVF